MPRGPKPDQTKGTTRNAVHKYKQADGVGWQHGEVPEPPDGLRSESVEAWGLWFGAWWAAFWTEEDVPGLRIMVELYDKVRRGEVDSQKLLPYLDRYGVTVKGQQDNRWQPHVAEPEVVVPEVPDEVASRRAERGKQIA